MWAHEAAGVWWHSWFITGLVLCPPGGVVNWVRGHSVLLTNGLTEVRGPEFRFGFATSLFGCSKPHELWPQFLHL